jgi:hypothetical protein
VCACGGRVSLNSLSSPKLAPSRVRTAVDVDRGRDEPWVHGVAVDARSREAALELVREEDVLWNASARYFTLGKPWSSKCRPARKIQRLDPRRWGASIQVSPASDCSNSSACLPRAHKIGPLVHSASSSCIESSRYCTSDSAPSNQRSRELCDAVPLAREGDDPDVRVWQGGGVPGSGRSGGRKRSGLVGRGSTL